LKKGTIVLLGIVWLVVIIFFL